MNQNTNTKDFAPVKKNRRNQSYYKQERVESEYQEVLQDRLKKVDDNNKYKILYLKKQAAEPKVGRYANGTNYKNLPYLIKACGFNLQELYLFLGLSLPELSEDVKTIYEVCSKLADEDLVALNDTAMFMTPLWWQANEEIIQAQFAPSMRLLLTEKRRRSYNTVERKRAFLEYLADNGLIKFAKTSKKNDFSADKISGPAVPAFRAWEDRHLKMPIGLNAIPYAASFIGVSLHWAFFATSRDAKLRENARNFYYKKQANGIEDIAPHVPLCLPVPQTDQDEFRIDLIEGIVDAYYFMGPRVKQVFLLCVENVAGKGGAE